MTTMTPVRTEAEYQQAMARVEGLWGAAPGSAQSDELDVLMTLVAAYEQSHEPIGLPDPVEAIRIRMADLGLTKDDLAQALSTSRTTVAAILNRRRRIEMSMVAPLAARLGLSAECLVQPYERSRRSTHGHVERTKKLARSLWLEKGLGLTVASRPKEQHLGSP